MATWYVSKAEGADANAGTSTSAPKSTPQAALNSASAGDIIEFIDSETYYDQSGSGHTYTLADSQERNNLTIRAGTDSDGNKYRPTISGKSINESGSIVGKYAVQYNHGWTIEGIEFRDFGNSGLIYSAAAIGAIAVRDCSFHHITTREGHGTAASADSAILLPNQGDYTTNIIERCIFYEIGARAVSQGGTAGSVTIRNCLIYSWGGEGGPSAANWNCILTQNTGSLVEHCIIANGEINPNTTKIPIQLGSSGSGGTFRYNIVEGITNNAGYPVVQAQTVDRNIIFNCGTPSDAFSGSHIAAMYEIGNIFDDPLFVNTASAESTTSNDGTHPDYTVDVYASPAVNGASGSTVTDDIRNDGNRRDSHAAGTAPTIGCYQVYSDWSSGGAADDNTEDFIIKTISNLSKEYQNALNKKSAAAPPTAPMKLAVRGPANLRLRPSAYGCSIDGDPLNIGKDEE